MRKGIILAGGLGTRLYPITLATSKQTLPIYNKPMIYYPLSVLMSAGIRDIALISTQRDKNIFKSILKNGKEFGVKIKYYVQDKPTGIPMAFKICKSFIKHYPSVLVLGDNIFHGNNLVDLLKKASKNFKKSTLFSYHVKDPQNFGVVETNKRNKVISLEEKPKKPKSNFIATGMYFMPPGVSKLLTILKPSKRKEFEIIDLLNIYLKQDKLNSIKLGKGFTWFDTGTHNSMLKASNFIKKKENNQKKHIGNIHEIAFRQGWISRKTLYLVSKSYAKSGYGKYLKKILDIKLWK